MNSKLYFWRLEELAVFGLWRDCKNIYISSGFLLRFGILSNAKFLPKIRLICQLKTNFKNQGQIKFSWFETISIKMSHLWISVEANSTFVFLSSPLLSFLMTGNHSYWGNLRHCHLTFLYLYWLCNSPYPRIPIEANTITWLKTDNCQELPPAMTPFSCRDSRQPGFVFESHLHRIVRRWQQNLSRPPFDSVTNDFLWPWLKFDDLFNIFLDQQMINIDEQWSTNDEQYQFQKWWEMDRLWCARKQYSKRWVDKNLWSKWSRKNNSRNDERLWCLICGGRSYVPKEGSQPQDVGTRLETIFDKFVPKERIQLPSVVSRLNEKLSRVGDSDAGDNWKSDQTHCRHKC